MRCAGIRRRTCIHVGDENCDVEGQVRSAVDDQNGLDMETISILGRPGVCAQSLDTVGDCARDLFGSWHVDAPLDAHHRRLRSCLDLCRACERCGFVSVSPETRVCRWYHDCPASTHSPSVDGILSYRTWEWWAMRNVSREHDEGRYARPVTAGPVAHGDVVSAVARSGAAWSGEWRPTQGELQPGFCAVTWEGDLGDCEMGDQGVHLLDPPDRRDDYQAAWTKAMRSCTDHCIRCARCVFVSLHFNNSDCSWCGAIPSRSHPDHIPITSPLPSTGMSPAPRSVYSLLQATSPSV